MLQGAVVVALLAQNSSIEEVRPRQIRTEHQSLFKNGTRPGDIALLQCCASDVDPAVWILGIDLGNFFESCLCRFQIALQEQSNTVIVPALPVFFCELRSRWRCRGIPG